ncbi:MAG: hypothetical protein IJV71_06705 [Lachnospiraceae bacterium]|nr:hypothetical protein [Lachnospiraceae bacterium]
MKKIFEKVKNNKKVLTGGILGVIAVTIVIVLVFVLTGNSETKENKKDDETLEVDADNIDSGANIDRGTWIKLYAEKFSMCNYIAAEPYYEDVTAEHELYAYVQTCVENDILVDGDKINLSEEITLKEAIIHLGKTYGYEYVLKRVGKETIADEDILDYMLQDEVLSTYADKVEQGFSATVAETILDNAYNSYMNREYENVANIVYRDEVVDLSELTDYEYVGDTLRIKTDEELAIGSIVILGATDDWCEGLALKVVDTEKNNGSYSIKVEAPQLDEVVESMEMEIDKVVELENFIPEDGVTATFEETEIAAHTSNLFNGKIDSPQIISNDFDASIKGTFLKLEVKLGDNKVKLSPSWERIGLKVDISQKSSNYFVNSNGEFSSKFESGIAVKGAIKLKDLVLKGSVGYKDKKVTFDVTSGITLENEITLEGKVEGKQYKLGTATVHLGWGITVNVDLYLKIDVNGKASVTTSISESYNIKKTANSGVNATAKKEKSSKLELAIEAKLLAGPDFVFKIWGLPIVDVYAYVGAGTKAKWSTNNPSEAVINAYLPIVHAGVGEHKSTVLSLIGVKAQIKILDMEKSLFQSPLISKITIQLYDEKASDEKTTTTEKITTEQETTTIRQEQTTTKKPEQTTSKEQGTSKEEETTNATSAEIEQTKYKLSKQSYDYVCAYDTDNQTYVVKKNGKYGVVTFDGTVKIDIKYEEFNLVGENLEFVIDGTAYVFNRNFKKIFEYIKKEVIANPDAYKIYYNINNEKYEFELFNLHLWDPEEVTEQVDGNSYVNRILYNDILIETYTYFSRINWQGVFVNKYKFINITTGDVICEEFGLKYGIGSAEGLFWCEGLIVSQFDSKDVILLSADELNKKVYLYSITDESYSKKELTNVYTLLQGVTSFAYGVEWITFYDDSYGKPFILNTKTLEIIYSEYDEYVVERFYAGRNGLYGAKKYDNEYYDLVKGYSIISTGYEGLDFSDDTYIRAWKDGKCIFMDYNGKKIAEFEKATGVVNGKALVSD